MYDSISELLNEIAAGEDAYLELKEVKFKGNTPRFGREEKTATEAIAQVFCAFANAEGGVVVFGVDDKRKEITGVPAEKIAALEQWVVNVAQHNCEPPVYITPDRKLWSALTGEERLFLKVDIPKSLYVHRTSGGHWMTRIGSHRADLRPEQLARLLERRRLGEPFEERPVPNAALHDLELALFEDYCRRRFGSEEEEEKPEVETRLINLKLAARLESGKVAPTVVGLLMFGKSPITSKLPGAYIDCVCYRGEIADANEQIDAKIYEGPLPEQILYAVRFAERWTPVAAEKNHEGRKDLPAFSLRAVHEAIVNTAAHRDYQTPGSNVRVFIFSDRMEISNPGGLHNSLRPENLFAGSPPYRRNQSLSGFLRDHHSPITGRALMETRGEGFLMMVRETRRIGGEIELRTLPDAVTVVLKSAHPNAKSK